MPLINNNFNNNTLHNLFYCKMFDLRICRICLTTEAKMYKLDQYQLKSYYDELLAVKTQTEDDSLPRSFCYECAFNLEKYHKFREKCYRGLRILQEMLLQGSITYDLVYKVDRIANNLKSPLDELNVNSRKVRGFALTYNADEIANENKKLHIIETDTINLKVDVKLDYEEYSEKDIDNDNLLDNKEDLKVLLYQAKDDQKQTVVIENEPERLQQAIVIDDEKRPVELKQTKLERHNKIKNSKQHHKTKEVLWRFDGDNWKTLTLKEEDALKEFQARADDPKYDKKAFKCRDCLKGFSKEDMLKRHTILRHKEDIGKHECRFCHFSFKMPFQIERHMKEHYLRYQCLRCPYVCALKSSAVLHEHFHRRIIKKCPHCNNEFRHISSYYTHLRTYHRSKYVCTLCGVSFVNNQGLLQHKKLKHIKADTEIPKLESGDFEDLNSFCERCDIRFETRKAYEEHIFHSIMHADGYEVTLNDGVAEIPPKVLGEKIKEQLKENQQKRLPEEDILNRRDSNWKESKKNGYRSKLPKRPTTCYQCGKHFETQSACLKHHIAEHPRTSFSPESARHMCEICGASLAPGSVQSHQNTHTREKMYRCETCGKEFNCKMSMKRHTLTHTGERPFACPVCGKRFTQTNSMQLHYRTIHLKHPHPKRNRRKKDPRLEMKEWSSSKADTGSVASRLKPRSGFNAGPAAMTQDNNSYFV